jgi:VWFA-related protein
VGGLVFLALPAAAQDRAAEPEPAVPSRPSDSIEERVRVRRIHVPVFIEPTRKNRAETCAALPASEIVVREDGVPADVTALDETLDETLHAILIDTSVSMRPRIDRAKSAAQSYVDGLDPEAKVLVASFDDNLILRTPPTTDRGRVADAIQALELGNNTALWDSLRYLIRYLEPYPGHKVVILLSDGEDSASIRNRAYEEIVALAAATPNLTLFPIGVDLDSRATFEGPDRRVMLGELARATGGSFYEVQRISSLSEAFARIERRLAGKSFVTYIPVPFGEGPKDDAENKTYRWRQVEIAVKPRNPCRVIPLAPPLRLEGTLATAPEPLEVTEVPEAHWAATSLETCIDPGSNRVTGGLEVHGGPGDGEAPATTIELWSLTPSRALLGKVSDITGERSALYDAVLYERSGQLRLRLNGKASFGERTFAIDVPPLDELRGTVLNPEDVIIRLLDRPRCAVASAADAAGDLGPRWVHGQTFLEMRAAVGLALFRFYPDYQAWATGRLVQDAAPEIEALLAHLRRAGTSPADLERARRSLEARAESPAIDQPQRYLAEWLGDVPATELAARVETRAARILIEDRAAGAPIPDVARRVVDHWNELRAWLPPPTRVRVLTPLLPAYDAERDVIGFYRVLLPAPRVGWPPVEQVPDAPYGLLTLRWLVEQGGMAEYLGGDVRLAALSHRRLDPPTARRLVNTTASRGAGGGVSRPPPTRSVSLEFGAASGHGVHEGTLTVTAYVSRDALQPDAADPGGPFCMQFETEAAGGTGALGPDLEKLSRALTTLIELDRRSCPAVPDQEKDRG